MKFPEFYIFYDLSGRNELYDFIKNINSNLTSSKGIKWSDIWGNVFGMCKCQLAKEQEEGSCWYQGLWILMWLDIHDRKQDFFVGILNLNRKFIQIDLFNLKRMPRKRDCSVIHHTEIIEFFISAKQPPNSPASHYLHVNLFQ